MLLMLLEASQRITADQHILLDTTKESMLDWTRYPYGPNSPTPGWVEESFTNFEKGINWRSYVVCDVGYTSVNNWLWTPFITRQDANRIYIEIKFSLRNCDLFPGTALQCKETFSLLYYEFDAATREPPPWEPESYKLIDRIAADEGRFTNNNEVIINTEMRSIDVTKKGVYFAFRDQGACLSLLAVKVYYLTCPESVVGFAFYPETATGSEISSIEKIPGRCVKNAVPVSEPHNLCKGDGTWNFNAGHCACMAGYESDEGAQECRQCPVGRYKHTSGAAACQICPPHSQALHLGSVQCRCNSGYFHAPTDPRTSACTRPPSEPQNLTYRFVGKQTIALSWSPPLDEGGRSDMEYKIHCDICAKTVLFQPNARTITGTKVQVSGLLPSTEYRFKVFALNGVSGQSVQEESFSAITVTTDSNAPSAISDIHIVESAAQQNTVMMTYSAPQDPSFDVQEYELRYFIQDSKANTTQTRLTRKDEFEIGDLRPDTMYGFQVRAKTAQGWGQFSDVRRFCNGRCLDAVDRTPADGKSSTEVRVTVGVVVAVVMTLAIIGAVYAIVKRNSFAWAKSQDKANLPDGQDYRSMDHQLAGDSLPIVQTHVSPSIYNPFSLHKTYVDPHTYEDPNIAVRQFAKEIDSRYITIEAIIGGGEFGDVCRGRLSIPDRNDMLVAIKTLKPGSSDKAKVDFLTEASIMGQFEHPNVIFLQGVVTKSNPIMIITEYMENGSLDTFLRANDGKFQMMQLVGMMRGIAYGMQYLAEMNYVHRDLAARNVLVNSQLVCKIADFGLSREISDGNIDGAYTTRGGKIPVRWTAPEAIAFRKFTSASDVWSFGIVMWEVMSYGERPYWTWSNQDVIKAIEKGYRLPAPMDCPEAIHQLMLDCWQKERSHRPSFVSIVKTLDKLICCPETLRKIAASPVHNPFSSSLPDYSSIASVDEWLRSIKMSRYADNFSAAGLVSMADVAKLSLQQLVDVGVTLVGHQKKIMGCIHAMRAQMSVNMSEGFLV